MLVRKFECSRQIRGSKSDSGGCSHPIRLHDPYHQEHGKDIIGPQGELRWLIWRQWNRSIALCIRHIALFREILKIRDLHVPQWYEVKPVVKQSKEIARSQYSSYLVKYDH